MSGGRMLVRGAFLSGVGMVLSMLGQLGAAVIFGRVLPEADIGTFWLLILASDCFVLITSFGLYSALPKIVNDIPKNRQAGTAASILLMQLIVSTVIGAIVLLAWLAFPNPAIVSENRNWLSVYPYLWAVPLLAVIATQRDTALAAMAGLNRFGARAGALVLGALVYVALVAAFVWWRRGDLIALMLCTVSAYFVSTVWLEVCVFGLVRSGFCWRTYWDAVRFSAPLYANNLMGFIFQRLDTVLVAVLLGSPAVVAYYEMAKRIPSLFGRILTATLVPYFPGITARLADGDHEGAARLLEKTSAVVAFLGYGCVLCVLVVQRPLVVLLFSDKYLASVPVLWLLMMGTCLGLQAGVIGQSLIALGRPASVTAVNVLAAGFSIALNFVLVPRYGIQGAGWVFVATLALSGCLQAALVRRAGLALRTVRLLIPQCVVAVCLYLSLSATSPFGRIAAIAAFVGGCLGLSVVSPRQLCQLAAFLVPLRNRGNEAEKGLS